MRAVRLVELRKPVVMQDVDVPRPQAKDVLVQVKAAGVCHSDAHYRSGVTRTGPLPVTLGHEVAGIVEAVGPEAARFRKGDRVAVHYLVACGDCHHCRRGFEQFCITGQMVGKHRDGGWADHICVPERSLIPLPPEVSIEQGAVMMCSSSTSLHALRKARLQGGESVAVFGIGGLGASALQLAKAMGALDVFAVDINPVKLALAESFGAHPVNAAEADPVKEIRRQTGGRGVDVAVEVVGLPVTMRQAVQSLAVHGRAAIAGLSDGTFEIASYAELLGKEAEVIGVADHLAQDMPLLMEFARRGALDLRKVITRQVPLDATVINGVLDELDGFGNHVRTVIVP
jgi:2-desacetyl-2-hydroxyethyl bacteriochlorophyllide A dehydrogenase